MLRAERGDGPSPSACFAPSAPVGLQIPDTGGLPDSVHRNRRESSQRDVRFLDEANRATVFQSLCTSPLPVTHGLAGDCWQNRR